MTNASGFPSHSQSALPVVRLTRGLRSARQSVMFVGDFRQRRTVVDVKRALSARIAENLVATGVRTSWWATRRAAELSSRAGSKGKNTMAGLKGRRRVEKGAHHGR
jgi:hypothetical protein